MHPGPTCSTSTGAAARTRVGRQSRVAKAAPERAVCRVLAPPRRAHGPRRAESARESLRDSHAKKTARAMCLAAAATRCTLDTHDCAARVHLRHGAVLRSLRKSL